VDRKTAESVVSSIEAATEQLDMALRLAQERFDKDDFEEFRSAVASVLVELQASVLRPVYLHHRDLDKFGYLRHRTR
jgi:hypothetical protein